MALNDPDLINLVGLLDWFLFGGPPKWVSVNGKPPGLGPGTGGSIPPTRTRLGVTELDSVGTRCGNDDSASSRPGNRLKDLWLADRVTMGRGNCWLVAGGCNPLLSGSGVRFPPPQLGLGRE